MEGYTLYALTICNYEVTVTEKFSKPGQNLLRYAKRTSWIKSRKSLYFYSAMIRNGFFQRF